MRKTPSSTPTATHTATPKAPAIAPSLTLFDAPPSRVPKPKASAVKASAVKASAIKASAIKASAVKAAPPKTAKKVSVQASSSKPAPVRVVAETPAIYFTGTGGRAWRMSGKHAVAYVQNAVLAGELLATEPRHLAKAAMAVYFDRKGKPFAWQFRFDTTRWEEVVRRLA
jgi:hypothetical protein